LIGLIIGLNNLVGVATDKGYGFAREATDAVEDHPGVVIAIVAKEAIDANVEADASCEDYQFV
jgi:hypothetical protein